LNDRLHGGGPALPAKQIYLHAVQAGLLIALVYFFCNTVGLPVGLTYTTLLAPFLYMWVLNKRKKDVLLPFLFLLQPFIFAHLFVVEASVQKYAVTMLNILAIYIFGQAFYTWLMGWADKEKVFGKLLLINTLLCFIALIFYFTPFYSLFWIQQTLTDNVDQFRRLKMFTYEASYYAMVFVPLFLFYFIRYVLRMTTVHTGWLLLMLFLPLVLSFSLGVIMCLAASGLVTFFIHFRSLHTKRRVVNGFISFVFISVIMFAIGIIFFRENPLFLRLENIFSGNDTSATGRTGDAFVLAQKILEKNNFYWGIGPGQLNFAGSDIIRGYYLYHHTTPVAIPNAAAETLVLFGWVGLCARLLIQIFLFFFTRVWANYYRLLLFVFIFLYQFMGSYITNVAEYVIWVLAFTNAFPELNVCKKEAITTSGE
jgi:hypothetical protein